MTQRRRIDDAPSLQQYPTHLVIGPTMTQMFEAPSSYPPADEFAEQANATAALYEAAEADRLGLWAEQANRLSWETPFTEVLDWSDAPFASGSWAAG